MGMRASAKATAADDTERRVVQHSQRRRLRRQCLCTARHVQTAVAALAMASCHCTSATTSRNTHNWEAWSQQSTWHYAELCTPRKLPPLATLAASMSSSALSDSPPDLVFEGQESEEHENPLVRNFDKARSWVGGQLTTLKRGFSGMYENFQEAREIRKSVKGGHAITYPEWSTLMRSKEDIRKVINVGAVWVFLPEVFPFMLSFFPNILPSTFESEESLERKYQNFNLARLRAALRTLEGVEKGVLDKKEKKRHEAAALKEQLALVLRSRNKLEAFQELQEHSAQPPPQLKAQQPKVMDDVPGPLVKGLGQALGLSLPFTPAWYARQQIQSHLKKLVEGDRALKNMALGDLPSAYLKEACCARALVVREDERSMRRQLTDWLQLADREVRVEDGMILIPERTRAILLGLNIVTAMRSSENSDLLRLLVWGDKA